VPADEPTVDHLALDADDPVEALHERGVTDGLPVIPPTPERVAAHVAASGRPADEVVARVPPAGGHGTVARLAANAVMAGCRPSLMPVVLAATRAMCEEAFNLYGVRTSNHPATPLFVVGGPAVGEHGFNAGTNVFGPVSRANATLGRAMNLIVQNVGGATPQLIDQSTMGHPGRYAYCIAEHPESPWAPLHEAEGGLPAGSSGVTAFAGDAPTAVADYASIAFDDLARSFAYHVANVWANPFYAFSEVMLVVNPAHARVLAQDGQDRAAVLERVGTVAREIAGALPHEGVAPYERGLHLVCAGGEWGQYSAIVTGWVGPGIGSTMTSQEV
jgi:hypothetical protein